MTEMFYLSLLGIFAILGGALILNVMSNLSKISEAVALRNVSPIEEKKTNRISIAVVSLSLLLIVGVLFTGNELSAKHKKELLVNAAEKLVAENQQSLATLTDYKFSLEYAKKSAGVLKVIRKIDKNFPEVMLIVPDNIGDKQVYLAFGGYQDHDEKKQIEMVSYIFSASQDEREYLQTVFAAQSKDLRFRGEKGSYQLYFPIEISGKRFVLYFSDYQRYGKYGS